MLIVLWIRIIGNQEHLKPKFSGERVPVSIPTEDVFKDTFNVGTWKACRYTLLCCVAQS